MSSDQDAIIRIINLYGLAVDTQDFELFDRIFTADVDARYNDAAHWPNRDQLKRDFVSYHAPFDGTQHIMFNHLVDVQGDDANCITYAHWRLYRKGVPGGDYWEGNGWYDDHAIRTAEGWRIDRRQCRIIWWGGNPTVNQADPSVSFDLPITSLRAEREKGTVWYYNAIQGGTAK